MNQQEIVLAFLHQRGPEGIRQRDFDDGGQLLNGTPLGRPSQLSREISRLNGAGHKCVKWQVDREWHYALKQFSRSIPYTTFPCGAPKRKATPKVKRGYGAKAESLLRKATGSFTDFYRARSQVVRMCQLLQSYESTIFWNTAPAEEIADVVDDLQELIGWAEHTMMVTATRLGDDERGRKIASLRNTKGRTPAEAETARRLADRLERQRSNMLEAV